MLSIIASFFCDIYFCTRTRVRLVDECETARTSGSDAVQFRGSAVESSCTFIICFAVNDTVCKVAPARRTTARDVYIWTAFDASDRNLSGLTIE